MRNLVVIGLFALVAVCAASDVLDYKDSNFDTNIREHDIALVEFYAPWCGHCKRLAPEYEKAATALKSNDPPVPLVKVDCTAETKTCQKYGVNGYPTLKIFKNGEISSDYNGPREADGIVKFMRANAGPSSRDLTSVADLDKFLAGDDHAIVGFFAQADSTLAAEFKRAADQLSQRFRFAHSSNPDVLAKAGHSDKIVIYQPPRLQVKLVPTENVYTGSAKSASIKSFIETEIHGIVGHRTPENARDFGKPLVVVLYNVDYVKDVKGTNYVRNRIIKVAQKLRGEGLSLNFAISNAEEMRGELAEFGIESPAADAKYVIARGARDEKFKFDGTYSPEALEQFARDLAAGNLEAYMKSEPIPTSNPDAVRTVVAKNFNEIVNDETKDVLIEFYAPWCGHCKTLAPKYEELAKKLSDENDIVIAKMDATANDVPPTFDVKGFPTLYFVPRNAKNSPRRYEGGREVDDFIKYLAKEATEPLSGFDRSGKKVKSKKKTDL